MIEPIIQKQPGNGITNKGKGECYENGKNRNKKSSA